MKLLSREKEIKLLQEIEDRNKRIDEIIELTMIPECVRHLYYISLSKEDLKLIYDRFQCCPTDMFYGIDYVKTGKTELIRKERYIEELKEKIKEYDKINYEKVI